MAGKEKTTALRARTYHSQNRETRVRVLTYNLPVPLALVCMFDAAQVSPYYPIILVAVTAIVQA